MFLRVRPLVALVMSGSVLTGCGGSSGSANPSSPQQQLPVAAGAPAGFSLANGDSVSLPAGLVAVGQNVTLSANAAETPVIPVPGWKAAPGTMSVHLPGGLAAATSGSVVLTFAFAAASAAQILAAQAPLLEVTTAKGLQRVSPDATFSAATNTLTATIPAALLSGATNLKLYAAIDGPRTAVAYGPRLWDATASPPHWIAEPFSVASNASTVVMVHGIFSSVETAFGPCEGSIIGAGGYGQAVGFDYDWTQPPAIEAPLLANFINSLPVSTVDLEAHSYGTVVTLAALPLITKKIGHVVLLGGPLPLNGSPQADPGYLRDLVLLGIFVGGYPSDVYHAVESGMVGSLATDSAPMESINGSVRALSPFPPFIQVAGQHALPRELSSDYVYALYLLLYGLSNNDGVVEEASALTTFPTTTTFVGLDLDHIQLECDPSVIGFVGRQVHP